MVTGDNLETAKAIAFEAGILTKYDLDLKFSCMEGDVFRNLCGGISTKEIEKAD